MQNNNLISVVYVFLFFFVLKCAKTAEIHNEVREYRMQVSIT